MEDDKLVDRLGVELVALNQKIIGAVNLLSNSKLNGLSIESIQALEEQVEAMRLYRKALIKRMYIISLF